MILEDTAERIYKKCVELGIERECTHERWPEITEKGREMHREIARVALTGLRLEDIDRIRQKAVAVKLKIGDTICNINSLAKGVAAGLLEHEFIVQPILPRSLP